MSRRFKLGDAAAILGTNPKTLKNWLVADGIDIESQLNRADGRAKFVTDEQIIAMAKKRDIEVRLPEERKTESTSARILAGVDERLAGLEQEFTKRVEQLAAKEIPALVDELRHSLEQQLTHHFDQLDARLERLEQQLAELERGRASAPRQAHPPTPALRASNAAPAISTSTPKTTTTRPQLTRHSRSKRKTKARKALPGTLVPLATFRQLHNVSEKAVENAVGRGKLAVVRGAWLYQHRSITVALDRQGQRQFYELFSTREGFQECDRCKHML